MHEITVQAMGELEAGSTVPGSSVWKLEPLCFEDRKGAGEGFLCVPPVPALSGWEAQPALAPPDPGSVALFLAV